MVGIAAECLGEKRLWDCSEDMRMEGICFCSASRTAMVRVAWPKPWGDIKQAISFKVSCRDGAGDLLPCEHVCEHEYGRPHIYEYGHV